LIRTIYSYNPFLICSGIAEVVWRIVVPDNKVEFDIDKALDCEPAPEEEIEWNRPHLENPAAFPELSARR
jgi:hypothetical protein